MWSKTNNIWSKRIIWTIQTLTRVAILAIHFSGFMLLSFISGLRMIWKEMAKRNDKLFTFGLPLPPRYIYAFNLWEGLLACKWNLPTRSICTTKKIKIFIVNVMITLVLLIHLHHRRYYHRHYHRHYHRRRRHHGDDCQGWGGHRWRRVQQGRRELESGGSKITRL